MIINDSFLVATSSATNKLIYRKYSKLTKSNKNFIRIKQLTTIILLIYYYKVGESVYRNLLDMCLLSSFARSLFLGITFYNSIEDSFIQWKEGKERRHFCVLFQYVFCKTVLISSGASYAANNLSLFNKTIILLNIINHRKNLPLNPQTDKTSKGMSEYKQFLSFEELRSSKLD